MIFAFAPIVALLLGLSAIVVPWQTLILSVVLYVVVPVILAQLIRRLTLSRSGEAGLVRLLTAVQPLSLMALLATLVLLFASSSSLPSPQRSASSASTLALHWLRWSASSSRCP
jgi:ACR3 family arsenite transporter